MTEALLKEVSHSMRGPEPSPSPQGCRWLWMRLGRTRLGRASGIVILLLYISALFADFLAPYGPGTQFIQRVHNPPQWLRLFDKDGMHWPFIYDCDVRISADGLERNYVLDTRKRHPLRLFHRGEEYRLLGFIKTRLHLFGTEKIPWFPLGTDRMGRDLLSRILHGGRISLTIGLVGVLVTTVLGTLVGAISGFYGGWADTLIQRLIELLMSFPAIPLWMALAAALPPHWSPLGVYFGIIIILSLVGWGGLARQIRGLVLSLRHADNILAARSFGASDGHIILRHLIPSCSHHLIVISTLAIPGTILAETALSFLGLGIRPPMTSWGVLLEEAQHLRVILDYPWLLLPSVPVLLAVVSFNLFGDALKEAYSF